MCSLCAASGDLLCCEGCPKVYHAACAGLDVSDDTACLVVHTCSVPGHVLPRVLPPRGALGLTAWPLLCLIHDLQRVPDDDFFCPTCSEERCGRCRKSRIYMNSHIICGDDDDNGCGKVFHLRCAGLKQVPEGDWFCPKCQPAEEATAAPKRQKRARVAKSTKQAPKPSRSSRRGRRRAVSDSEDDDSGMGSDA